MIITIRNPFILRLFWGKRQSYPSYVTASHGLWFHWFKENILRRNKIEGKVKLTEKEFRTLSIDDKWKLYLECGLPFANLFEHCRDKYISIAIINKALNASKGEE